MNLRIRLALVCVLIFAITPLQAQTAESLITAALKKATAENKTVMLEFRADWCKYCKALDRARKSPELSKLFDDNYVVVDLTVQESEDKKALETPGADAILEEIGASKAGIPMMIFIDQKGAKIANSMVMPKGVNIGYPMVPEEIKAFGGLLEKTALHMTAAQRNMILDWLTKNAATVQ
jgi:thioredoxin-related protein